MTIEHIINRIERLASIIEMDAKQESTKQYAKSIRTLTDLARKGIETGGGVVENPSNADDAGGQKPAGSLVETR